MSRFFYTSCPFHFGCRNLLENPHFFKTRTFNLLFLSLTTNFLSFAIFFPILPLKLQSLSFFLMHLPLSWHSSQLMTTTISSQFTTSRAPASKPVAITTNDMMKTTWQSHHGTTTFLLNIPLTLFFRSFTNIRSNSSQRIQLTWQSERFLVLVKVRPLSLRGLLGALGHHVSVTFKIIYLLGMFWHDGVGICVGRLTVVPQHFPFPYCNAFCINGGGHLRSTFECNLMVLFDDFQGGVLAMLRLTLFF